MFLTSDIKIIFVCLPNTKCAYRGPLKKYSQPKVTPPFNPALMVLSTFCIKVWLFKQSLLLQYLGGALYKKNKTSIIRKRLRMLCLFTNNFQLLTIHKSFKASPRALTYCPLCWWNMNNLWLCHFMRCNGLPSCWYRSKLRCKEWRANSGSELFLCVCLTL